MVSSETTYLSISKEDAARHVSRRVAHLRRSRDDGTIRFRTNVGIHLATLSDVTLDSGDRGARLRYRTSAIRPHLFHAHNKSREIRDSLRRFRTDTPG